MRRGLAVIIVLSLWSLQVQSLAFHVHRVPDHAQREHHHGPAIHHHDDFDSARHVDEGDRATGGTVIRIAVPAATASTIIDVHAELVEVLPVVELELVGDARAIEVRSHGPPPAHKSFLRGPPTFYPILITRSA